MFFVHLNLFNDALQIAVFHFRTTALFFHLVYLQTENPSDKASVVSNPQDEAKSSESTPEPPEIDLEDSQQCNKSVDSSARQAPAGCDTEVTDKEEALVEKEANVVTEGKAEEQSSCA